MRALPLLLVLAGCPDRSAETDPHNFLFAQAQDVVRTPAAKVNIFLDEDGAVHVGAKPASVAEVEELVRGRYPTLVQLPGPRTHGTLSQYEEPDCSPVKNQEDPQLAISLNQHQLWAMGTAGRHAWGAPIAGAVRDPVQPVILYAAATADARVFVDLVAASGAAIGVVYGVMQFDFSDEKPSVGVRHAIALRVSRNYVELDRVGRFDVSSGTTAEHLRLLLERSRTECHLHLQTRIDVIVEDGVDVQRVVDVLEALRLAGEQMVGLMKS